MMLLLLVVWLDVSSATATQKLELPPVAPGSLPADGDEFVSIVLENLLAALEVESSDVVYYFIV